MSNVRSNNTWYVDTAFSTTADDLTNSVVVTAIVATATGASGRIVLSDPTTSAIKLDLRIDPQNSNASGGSKLFDFSNSPVVFPNGVRVLTLTTATATLIGREAGRSD